MKPTPSSSTTTAASQEPDIEGKIEAASLVAKPDERANANYGEQTNAEEQVIELTASSTELSDPLPENFTDKHRAAYSPEALFSKLAKLGGKGGFELLNRVLQLYYLARTPDIPVWVKGMVVAALGYFIVTPDAIPDITPVVGFVDDLGVLATTLAAVASYISPKIKKRAAERLKAE